MNEPGEDNPIGDTSQAAAGFGVEQSPQPSVTQILKNAVAQAVITKQEARLADDLFRVIDRSRNDSIRSLEKVKENFGISLETEEDVRRLDRENNKLGLGAMPIRHKFYDDGSDAFLFELPLTSATYIRGLDQSFVERILRNMGSLPEGMSLEQLAARLPRIEDASINPVVPRESYYFANGGVGPLYKVPFLAQLPTIIEGVQLNVAHQPNRPLPPVVLSYDFHAFRRMIGEDELKRIVEPKLESPPAQSEPVGRTRKPRQPRAPRKQAQPLVVQKPQQERVLPERLPIRRILDQEKIEDPDSNAK